MKLYTCNACRYTLRHSILAGLVKTVCGTDFIQRFRKVVAILVFNMLLDAFFALRRIIIDRLFVVTVIAAKVITTHKDCISCCHCAFDTFRVIVCDLC